MWKTIYIADDMILANILKKKLKSKGIKAILNKLELEKDELNGNVKISVPMTEEKKALDIINKVLIY
ncbi:MAG: hypothetical protein U9N03_02920 [Candidatus Caldatribacteriota bacterium]|nr:hypothetical protein [Candidatus Caldatribacteriota bacterium]